MNKLIKHLSILSAWGLSAIMLLTALPLQQTNCIAFSGSATADEAAGDLPRGNSIHTDPLPTESIVEAKGFNLLENPGMEKDASGWGRNETLVTINTEVGFTHSGEKSFMVAAGADKEAFAYTITPENLTYNRQASFTAGMWVYLSMEEDADKVTIHLERPDSPLGTITAHPRPQRGWQKVSVDGDASSKVLRHAVKFTVSPGNKGAIYFDDAYFYCSDLTGFSLIRNPRFEKGKEAWGGEFEVTTVEKHDGSNSALLRGPRDIFQASGWWLNREIIQTDKDLYLSAWVKSGGNSGSCKLRAEIKKAGVPDQNIESDTVAATQTSWQEITVKIPANIPRDEILFHCTTEGTASLFYVDTVTLATRESFTPAQSSAILRNSSLENLNADGSITDWDVWPGNPQEGVKQARSVTGKAHSGKRSLLIEPVAGNNHAVYQYCIDKTKFDFNESYTASVWVNLENVKTDNLSLGIKRRADDEKEYNVYKNIDQTAGKGWTKVKLDVPGITDKQIKQYDVIVDIGKGSGKIYLDDFDLTKSDTPKRSVKLPESSQDKDNVLRNPGLETLNDDGSVRDWDVWPGNPSEGERRYKSVTAPIHGGKRAIMIEQVPDNKQAIYQYCVDASAFDFTASYMVSVWLKAENLTSGKITLGIKRKDALGHEYNLSTQVAESGDIGWKEIKLAAPGIEGANIGQYDVIVDVPAGKGKIYLDDFKLSKVSLPKVKASDLIDKIHFSNDEYASEAHSAGTESRLSDSILRNAGLEIINPDGSVRDWDVWPGKPEEGTRRFKSVMNPVHSGRRSLLIEPVAENKHAVYQYCINPSFFDFNASYIASVWLKTVDLQVDELTLGVKRKNAAGEENNYYLDIKRPANADWFKVEIPVPGISDTDIVQYDVIVDIGRGRGKIYLDDFDLRPADIGKQPFAVKQLKKTVSSAQNGDLLRNAGLEILNADGTIRDWDVWPGNPKEGVRMSKVVTDQHHSGTRSLLIEPVSGNKHAVYQYCTDHAKFDFNASYVASVWAKLENVKVSELTFGVKRKTEDGKESNIYTKIKQADTNGWVNFKVEAPGISDKKIVQYDVIVDIGEGSGKIYLDDFSLKAANLPKKSIKDGKNGAGILRNPSLENLNPDGSILDWDVWPGKPEEGKRNYEVCSDAHSGEHAVKINLEFSNAQAIYQYCVEPDKFDFNADYILSVFMKMDKVSIYDGSGISLGVKRTDSQGNVHVTKTNIPASSIGDWKQFKLDVPAFDGIKIVQYDVIVDIGAGKGSVYLDDFDLKPADLANLPNPNVKKDTAENNKKLDLKPVKVQTREGHSYATLTWWLVSAGLAVLILGGAAIYLRKSLKAK